MFEISRLEELWSSIFWAQRRGKREHQMWGCHGTESKWLADERVMWPSTKHHCLFY